MAPDVFIDDPPDEFGAEMAKEARVWKTYVRESDRSDKEMVDGRNKFVIASLSDLKPDPAESSAQTLLVMSQMLAAIANNQPVASPPPGTLDPPAFSPSHTAVVVNILWFLSLSLSVAVSLVAMLAKEWCYKFMSGRSGPAYDQARKRQQKWNGMEKWKMKKILIYLPAMMHLALFVALLLLILLPHWLHQWFAPIVPVAAKDGLHTVKAAIKAAVIAVVDVNDKLDDLHGGSARVPMDTVTSQMLAWLIATCEDSRSVDTALQAIAGARSNLPHGPLVDCRAIKHVLPRLDAYLKSKDNSSTALRYSLAYGVLMSGGAFRAKMDGWSEYDNDVITDDHLKDTDDYDHSKSNLTYAHARASIVITAMPLCHWKNTYRLEASRQREVVEIANTLLRQHLQPNQGVLSTAALSALVESTAHYLVGLWPREKRSNPSSLLPILLAHIFFAYHDTNLDVAHAVAVTLAATAFATRSYPGGETPSDNVDVREKRAVDVLKYYNVRTPDRDTTQALFIFGFFGILPELGLRDEETRVVALPRHFNEIMQRMPRFDFNHLPGIRTLPRGYSLRESLLVPALQSLSSIASGESSPDGATAVFNCLPLLIHRPRSVWDADSKLYVLALMALSHANCVEIRDLCLNIIDAQPIPRSPMDLLESSEGKELLEQLCRALVDTNTPIVPIMALHFELLIASVIIDPYHGDKAAERQSALRILLNFRDRFRLGDPSPINKGDPFPDLKSATDGSRQGSMLRAMQCILNFCEAGVTALPGDSKVAWLDELQKWKDNCSPGTTRITLPVPTGGRSSTPVQSGSSSTAAAS
ncbi:hypothetical protein FRC10_004227 [Ceratobasidium sp. 414]|nr:hypothetical protein FRC10_004227 [Ceratobasidium sp. 414]